MNYTKKSLSLFLAVLMVLSCWTWVAPANVSAEETFIEEGTDASVEGEETKTTKITIAFSMGDEKVYEVVIGEKFECVAEAERSVGVGAYKYSFYGWYKGDVKVTDSKVLSIIATEEEETYTAKYIAIKNKYTITYVAEDGRVIDSYNYYYGDVVNHTVPTAPFKQYDEDEYGVHYKFDKWVADVAEPYDDNKVIGNVTYTATYEAKPHVMVEKQVDATCTAPGGLKYICECGYFYPIATDDDQTVPAQLPHDVEYVFSTTPATIYADGERTVWCKNCGVATEKLEKLVATNMAIQVYDDNGEPARYATVELYYTEIVNKKPVEVQYTDSFAFVTDDKGFINIAVPENFEGWVARVRYNGGSHYCNELVTGDEINVIGEVGKTKIAIKVFDSESELVKNAKVELFYTETVDGETKSVQYEVEGVEYKTDKNGYIEIEVPTNYSGWNVKIYYSEGVYSGDVVTIKEKNVNVFGEEPEDYVEAGPCSCSCHKRGPVGFTYRLYKYFMEKFSKSEIKCCTSPEKKIFLSFFSF